MGVKGHKQVNGAKNGDNGEWRSNNARDVIQCRDGVF
jgi:hypothetical protein